MYSWHFCDTALIYFCRNTVKLHYTGHEPTAAAYRTHKYNWSITTARTLTITLDLGNFLSIHLHGLLTKVTRSLSVGVMLKNADTGHYMVPAAIKGSCRRVVNCVRIIQRHTLWQLFDEAIERDRHQLFCWCWRCKCPRRWRPLIATARRIMTHSYHRRVSAALVTTIRIRTLRPIHPWHGNVR